MHLLLTVMLVLVASLALAEQPIPAPPEGYKVLNTTPCVDNVTKQTGICTVAIDASGQYWVVFWQENQMMEIRKPTEDGFEVIWTREGFGQI